jgi:hypothetical protein
MKTWTVRSLVCLACSAVALATASAQTDQGQQQVGDTPAAPVQPAPQAPQGPQRPQYLDLRYNEDWSHIKEVAGPPDFWDPIKYIQLNDRGWYMSLGGEIRERYDNWHNPNFGFGAVNVVGELTPAEWLNGSLQRYMFHADTHMGEHVRVFVQTQSALEFGKKGGPWYTDKDTIEIHQGFIDFRSSEDPKHYTLLRVGRQEIALGTHVSARFEAGDHFVSTSDYFNARRNFDGVTLTVGRGSWTWFGQATKPVLLKPGAFDDAPEHGRTSWGGGFFAPNPFTKQGQIGVFYTGLDTKHQLWQRGLGRDQRHTIGALIGGAQKGWDYTYETLVQLGTFTPVQGPSVGIRAWAFTTDNGFTFQKSRHYPRIGLSSSFTSGDSGHGNLGTLHPLFPDTTYSGKMGLVGPSNGYEVTPTFRLGLTRRIYWLNEWSFFWRQNIHDAVYSPGLLTVPVDSGIVGFIEKPGNFSTARFIGSQAGTAAMITIDRHLTCVVAYAHFVNVGQFLKETPPDKRTALFMTFLNYSF